MSWLRDVVASFVITGTWVIWAVKVWNGQPINPLLYSVIIVIVLGAAGTIFGWSVLRKAVDMMASVRDTTNNLASMRDE